MGNEWIGRAVVAMACIGAAVTCGGRAVQSGVDPNKRASDLTPAEYETVCEELSRELAEATSTQAQQDVSCRLTGFIAAAIQAALTDNSQTIRTTCLEHYDACMMEEPGPNMVPTTLSCDRTSTSCDATVGEIEDCGNDVVQWFADARAALPSCNELSSASFGQDAEQRMLPATPTSCDLVRACAE